MPVPRIVVLGQVSAYGHDGEELGELLTQPKLYSLLVYLLIEGVNKPLPVEQVCAVFWPDWSTTRARRSLNQLVHTAKRTLRVDPFERYGSLIRIRTGSLTCDAIELDSGTTAPVASHGELLPGFALDTAPEFDRWLDVTRERFRRAALNRLVQHAERALHENDIASTLRLSESALHLDAYNESAAALYMRALRVTHGAADVQRFFQLFRARLGRDLDAVPSLEFASLMNQLCNPRYAPAVKPVVSSEPEPPAPLVGRTFYYRYRSALLRVVVGLTTIVFLSLLMLRPTIPRLLTAADEPPPVNLVISIGDSEDASLVVAYVADRLADHGLQIVREATDSSGGASFVLGGHATASDGRVVGVVQLMEPLKSRVLHSWRLSVRADSLAHVSASIADSVRAVMRNVIARSQFAASGRDQTAVSAMLAARRLLDQAVGSAYQSAVATSLQMLTRADSLAAVAGTREPFWPHPHLLRAQIARVRALQHMQSGDAEAGRSALLGGLAAADSAVRRGSADQGRAWRGILTYYAWTMNVKLDGDLLAAAAQDLEWATARGSQDPAVLTALSAVLYGTGLHADAYNAAERALEQDVFGMHTDNILVRLYESAFDMGRVQQAAGWCDEIRRRNGHTWIAADCSLTVLAFTPNVTRDDIADYQLSLSQMTPQQAQSVTKALELLRAAVFARHGFQKDARRLLKQFDRTTAPDDASLRYASFAFAQLGDTTRAYDVLGQYLIRGGPARRATLYRRWYQPLYRRGETAVDFASAFPN